MSTTGQYQVVPLEQLHESPLNPRKTYSASAMQDLTTSIRAKGVITPLLVRPNADGFEIAAGHRRCRAAQAAGLEAVPAVVRPMDDVTFLEVLIMENDEREDLHPLEEAQGYKTLMTRAGYTVERIAERRGCSVKYIYDRVKLLELIPAAQQLFREGRFTAGHAILLARLKPEEQKRAIDPAEPAVFQDETTLWNADAADGAGGKRTGKPDPYEDLKPRSVRELEAWIAEHVRFKATEADPFLFPEATTAVTSAAAAKEKVVEITHDSFVQEEARDGRTIREGYWKRADGTHGSRACERAVTGVIVVGPGQGDAFKVCVDRERCAVHWGAEIKAKAQRAKAPARSARSGGSAKDSYAREEQKRKEKEARRQEAQARWKKALPAILEAIAAAVKKAPTKATGLLASLILDQCQQDYQARHLDVGRYVPRGTDAQDLIRHAAFTVLAVEIHEWSAFEEFPKRAKAFGLDVGKIVDEAAPKPAAEAKEAPKKAKKK